jgi:hypothetical protein
MRQLNRDAAELATRLAEGRGTEFLRDLIACLQERAKRRPGRKPGSKMVVIDGKIRVIGPPGASHG